MTLTSEQRKRAMEILDKLDAPQRTTNRSETKDAVAAALIFGDTTVAFSALLAGAVSLDLLNAGQARGVQMATSTTISKLYKYKLSVGT